MAKKRSVGVTVYAVLYLLFAALMLPNAIMHLWVVIYSLFHIGAPASGHDPSGFQILILALAGLPFSVLPSLIFATIGIGLFKLSNKIRIFLLVANSIVGIFLIIFINNMFTKPWKFSPQPSLLYKISCFGLVALLISSMVYLLIPKVKGQFKKTI